MLPALIAQLLSLVKTTSLVDAIGVMDFFRAVRRSNGLREQWTQGAMESVVMPHAQMPKC
jgi:ABC-type amino acid transport system permease subunit